METYVMLKMFCWPSTNSTFCSFFTGRQFTYSPRTHQQGVVKLCTLI